MQDMRLKLRPGETIRSPRILQVYWFGDDPWHGTNQFRRVMFAHVMPRIDGQLIPAPIAQMSNAFYELDRATEADMLSYLESIKGLGFEYYWMDAYYGKDDFPTVGNYVFPLLRGFNQKRFPRGVKPIAEAVRREGMHFLMWFEPERICPGTLIAKEHPEWVVLPKDGWGMFNLGVPDARRYLTRYLNASIKEYGIRCLRIDNAVQYRGLWEQVDKANPDRRGMAEIRYVEGLYRLWDDLLKTNPSLLIDNCASGGGRVDLETCARSIPLWRTDATIDPLMKKNYDQAAMQNQAMTAGLSRFVPFNTSGQMGTSPYLFRSGLNGGGIAFAEDVRPASYPRDILKQAIAEAKRLRPYFFGDLYVLSDVTVRPEDWCVYQFHRSQEQDGMVMAFRRSKSPKADLPVKLREIDLAADYDVTQSVGYDPGQAKRMKGAELASLVLHVEPSPGSVIIEYRRVKP
jgi:alpha-galactosidase